MSGPERFRGVLGRVLEAFDTLGIRWCLTRSTVSAHYGVPRATMDVDYLHRWSRELGVEDLLEAAWERPPR